MSIATAILNAQQRVADAYTAISNKGGTLPATQNLANMPTAIDSIPSGSGTKCGISIDNIIGDTTTSGGETTLNSVSGTTTLDLTGIQNVGQYALRYKFTGNTSITGFISDDVEKIGIFGLYYTFQGNTSLVGNVDLSSLISVESNGLSNTFNNTGITGINLSSLEYVSENAFNSCCAYCNGITGEITIPIKYTKGIGGGSSSTCFYNMFSNSYNLEGLILSRLEAVYGGSQQFYNICNGCRSLTSFTADKLKYIGFIVAPSWANTSATYYVFNSCCQASSTNYASLTKFSFKSLRMIAAGAAQNCHSVFYGSLYQQNKVLEFYLPELFYIKTTASSSTLGHFAYNNYITSICFPKFSKFARGGTASSVVLFATNNTNLSSMHFGKKYKTIIEGMEGYSTLWGRGAGNATVYFDLINVITCNGKDYFRCAINDDDTNGKYAWVNATITVNGNTYTRYKTGDSMSNYVSACCPFAWQNQLGTSTIYTDCENPLIDDFTGTAYDNISNGLVTAKTEDIVYTTNRDTPAVGDDYYTESGGTYTVAGQITAIE